MKTVVVLSDTHGNLSFKPEFERVLCESDFIIHLGDLSQDGAKIKSRYNQNTFLINGNCDMVKLGEDEQVVQIEGVNIFLTHGHRYSVKQTLFPLAQRAKSLECKIALYGHTHNAAADEIDGVCLLNGGTLSRFAKKSYLYLVINKDSYTHKIVWLN